MQGESTIDISDDKSDLFENSELQNKNELMRMSALNKDVTNE